jgi:hypothetical protein
MTRQKRHALGLLTTTELAARFKITTQRLSQIAKERGVEPAIRVGRAALWMESQARDLKPGPPGWPRGRKKAPTKKKIRKAKPAPRRRGKGKG